MNKKELEEILQSYKNIERANKFSVTKSVNFNMAWGIKGHFYIDEGNKMWCVPHFSQWSNKFIKEKTVFHLFSDIKGFEIQDESKKIISTTSKTSGGLGSAAVGGLLFGVPGAIVGGMTGGRRTKEYASTTLDKHFIIHIILDDIAIPCVDIYCDDKKAINEITSILYLIIEKNNEEKNNKKSDEKELKLAQQDIVNNSSKVADTLKKFKELLDIGAITQEEFDNEKRQLLHVEKDVDAENILTEKVVEEPKIATEVVAEESKVITEIYTDKPKVTTDSNLNIKYCINCGAQLKKNSNFCTNCGHKTNSNILQNTKYANKKMASESEELGNNANRYDFNAVNKNGSSFKGKFNSFLKSYIFIWIVFLLILPIFSCVSIVGLTVLRLIATQKHKLNKEKFLYKFIEASRIEIFFRGLIAWTLILCGFVFLFIDAIGVGVFWMLCGISCFESIYKKIKPEKIKKICRILLPLILFLIPIVFLINSGITEVNFSSEIKDIGIGEKVEAEFSTNLKENNPENFTWTSSDNAIVSIDNKGVMTGLSEGSAIVTIESKNGKSDTLQVNVKYIEAKEIAIDVNDKIFVGEDIPLRLLVTPSNATNRETIWEIDNKEIADIKDGFIKAKSLGSIILKAISENGISTQKEIEIGCYPVQSLKINVEDIVVVGNEYDVNFDISPNNIKKEFFEISSSNPKIVKIEENKILPLTSGKVTLKVRYLDGTEYSKEITSIVEVESVKFNNDSLELKKDNTSKLKVTISPANASDKSLTWISSNPNIASVDENGNVKGMGKGSTTISAMSQNGKVAECIVSVKEKSPVTINNFRYTVDYVGGVEWTFSLTNNTKKTINYITLKWYCFNGVGDLIYDSITWDNYVSLRYTGPLKPGATSSTRRNMTKFYNSSYKSSKISDIVIEYEDGTKETIKNSDFPLYYGITN